ncbi:MAG: 5'-3' exonuclease H3TH domain-containing protein [Myxococcota bacterium]
MKIFLVDGTYELFRAYHGAPPAQAPDGRPVGAVRGMARSLMSMVRDEGARYAAIAFDTVIESFRNELFPGYKRGDGIDPDLLEQFPLAEEMARALGFVVWPMKEFEADDALASGAVAYARDDRVEQVLVCSPDKDLTQVVDGGKIITLDRRRRLVLDREGVLAKFGVGPESIPDYLALVGDSADGIPGIPRWGAKGASAVLSTYPHLEDIPSKVQDWSVKVRGAQGLSAALEADRENAYLYRKLATLRLDVPIPADPAELAWTGAPGRELGQFCAKIGDERLLERVPKLIS